MIVSYLKIFLRKVLRLLIRVLFLFPLKKNRILFESFQGRQFADNPREVYRFLRREYADKFEYVCSLTDPSALREDEGIRAVRYKSLQWFICQATSAVIVSNTLPITIFPKRRGQLFIETWHGGGAYKTLAVDFRGYSPARQVMVRWNNTLLCDKIDVFLSSSEGFTQAGIVQPYGYSGTIANTGMPRNDLFFSPDRVKAAEEKVRQRYRLTGTVILYAPTWRGTDFQNTKRVGALPDLERILSQFPDASILFRRHYADRNRYEFNRRVIDAAEYPDMQELLCASDVLITDYSSSIWDYALLGRPCLLYVPDLYEYEEIEHGFCTPIDSWPGTVCTDMDELCLALKNMDPQAHQKRAEEHLRALTSYENGTACRQTADLIINHIETI